jgi:predicted kinase
MILVRGLPASGKSTLARRLALAPSSAVFEADNFFIGADGVYRFDIARIAEAHKECISDAKASQATNVIVANTFTQRWEMNPYIDHAKSNNMTLTVITVQTDLTDEQLAARNLHGVPVNVIAMMRARFEHDWQNGKMYPFGIES